MNPIIVAFCFGVWATLFSGIWYGVVWLFDITIGETIGYAIAVFVLPLLLFLHTLRRVKRVMVLRKLT